MLYHLAHGVYTISLRFSVYISSPSINDQSMTEMISITEIITILISWMFIPPEIACGFKGSALTLSVKEKDQSKNLQHRYIYIYFNHEIYFIEIITLFFIW